MSSAIRTAVKEYLEGCLDPSNSGRLVEFGAQLVDVAGANGRELVLAELAYHTTGSSAKTRVTAAFMLVHMGAEGAFAVRAVEELAASLRAENVEQVAMATYLLGRLKNAPPRLVPELKRLLNHKNRGIQVFAAVALPGIDGDSAGAIAILGNALRSDDVILATTAARAFVKFGLRAEEAIGVLEDLLKKVSPEIQPSILNALAEMGEKAAIAIPTLIEMLESNDVTVEVRACTARDLGAIARNNRAVRAALIKALYSPYWQVVWCAVMGLKRNGDGRVPREAVEALGTLLATPDIELRATAARSLCECESQAGFAVLPLMKQLERETDVELCNLIVDALTTAGEAAIPALIEALQPPNPRILTFVTNALAQIGDTALDPLLRLLLAADGENVRQLASWVLHCMGPRALPAVPTLCELLQRSHGDIQRDVIVALAALGPSGISAAPVLVRLLLTTDDEEVALWSERGLVSIGAEVATFIREASVKADRRGQDRLQRILRHFGEHAPETQKEWFAEFDDESAVELYVGMCEILITQGPISLRGLPDLLAKQKQAGKLSQRLFTSEEYIRKKLTRMEEFLTNREGREIRLINRTHGKSGVLTVDGERVYQELKRRQEQAAKANQQAFS